MQHSYITRPFLASLVALGAACGGDELCDPVAQSGCDNGETCELVVDGEPTCFASVIASGRVFDLATDDAIEGARVVAIDANGAPASAVAVTDAAGGYDLVIPATRNADGTPVGQTFTLRAAAAGFQTFPSGIRQALPVDVATAVAGDDGLVIESALTDIGLLALEDRTATGVIRGTVEVPADSAGVLVVAESGRGFSAIADRSGDYVIFNLPADDYEVAGYSRGANYEPVAVSLPDGGDATADLALSDAPTSTLTGTIQLVNPGDGDGTSIVLAVASTFDPVLLRGETPPGLRAPDPGLAPDISGQFSISGVPDGRYVVLASFEDDFLVRDPDTCIAGTELVFQDFAGEDVELVESFKVTGSLDIISPGADGAEPVEGNPVFTWADDSSEDQYDLVVLDAFGNEIWTHTEPGVSGDDPAVPYGGPPLERGMFYQFRVVSSKATGAGQRCELSQTEDLKGVFFLP